MHTGKNRLHGVLRRHNLRCPEQSLFSTAGLAWLDEQHLPGVDELQVRHLVSQLTFLQDQLDETDRIIARQASQDPRVPHLMQLTGIGYFAAFAILAAIGDIGRFPTPGCSLPMRDWSPASINRATNPITGPSPKRDVPCCVGY